jgi:hypothetical protein
MAPLRLGAQIQSPASLWAPMPRDVVMSVHARGLLASTNFHFEKLTKAKTMTSEYSKGLHRGRNG